jgi:hypothetical protein
MSTVMDTQDMLGGIRGMCLVAVVRRAMGPFSRASAEDIVRVHIREKVTRFADSLHDFTGVDASSVIEAMVDSVTGSEVEEHYAPENINMQLSLLSGHPIPPYPFIAETRIDTVALARPYLDISLSLLHAAVRVRMQGTAPLVATAFWSEAILFLDGMWGPSSASRAMACATVADVVSDVLFYNRDISSRTIDPALLARASAVMAELGDAWASIEKYA